MGRGREHVKGVLEQKEGNIGSSFDTMVRKGRWGAGGGRTKVKQQCFQRHGEGPYLCSGVSLFVFGVGEFGHGKVLRDV